MDNLQSFLSQFDQEYKEAEVSESTGELPDGKYNAVVDVARFTRTKEGNRPMIEFQFVIADGKYKGRREWKYHVLESGRMQFIKYDLVAMHIELQTLAQLPDVLPTVINTPVELQIKTKKTDNGNNYRNVYVNKSDHVSDSLPDFIPSDDMRPF